MLHVDNDAWSSKCALFGGKCVIYCEVFYDVLQQVCYILRSVLRCVTASVLRIAVPGLTVSDGVAIANKGQARSPSSSCQRTNPRTADFCLFRIYIYMMAGIVLD